MKRKQAADELGVAFDASADDIDRVFRKRTRGLHPDLCGDASSEEMSRVSAMRDLLKKDADIRRQSESIVLTSIRVAPNEEFRGVVKFRARCATCNGRGLHIPVDAAACRICGGAGVMELNKGERAQCTLCMGSGAALTLKDRCVKCEGRRSETVSAYVKFTAPREFSKGDVVYKKSFGGRNGVKEIHVVANK